MTGRLRAAGIAAVATVGAVGIGAWLRAGPIPGHEGPEPTFEAATEDVAGWFAALRAHAPWDGPPGDAVVHACRIAPPQTPSCTRGAGPTVADAVRDAADGRAWFADGTLRLDVVLDAREATFPAGTSAHTAGVWGFEVGDRVILPMDVLATGLFGVSGDEDDAAWRVPALEARLGVTAPFRYRALRTATWVQRDGEAPVRTYRLHPWDPPDALDGPIRAGGEHLLSLVRSDGRIRYRWTAVAGREAGGQNLLRHAGTVWSLLRAGERLADPRFAEASDRAIRYLLGRTGTDERSGPRGGGRVRYVVEGSHLKLGGAGLGLLALATRQRLSGDPAFAREAEELATFLLSQQEASGEFHSFAPKIPGGEPKDEVSEYYPGEAVLGLAAWHEVTRDPRWLEAARVGADWLIDVRDGGKGVADLANDHWLMMALERLHALTGDPRYAAHAKKLGDGVVLAAARQADHARFHRDYAGGFYEPPRSTPASIRAEGLGAVLDVCARAPEVTGSCDELRRVLHDAVRHVLLSQYTPDTAAMLPHPAQLVGGFAGGIVDPDLRNDFSQHAFCALLAVERHP